MTSVHEFQEAAETAMGPVLAAHGFRRQPLEVAPPEMWATFRSAVSEVVVHYDLGAGAWVTVGKPGGASWHIETLATARAGTEPLPTRPHRGISAILGYYADLLAQYCRPELTGDFKSAS